jgi:YfiH family protein
MGSRRGSGAAGQRGGRRGAAHAPAVRGVTRAPFVASETREIPISGPVPRFEIPGWRKRYGVVAGITGRGSEPGRGFDLGLWSSEPVGEVMSRWLAFRRTMHGFQAFALGNQVHGTQLMRLDQGRGWIQMEAIDGWITTAPGILLTVTVADCVPVYLVAPGRAVALLHAGWRGVAGSIIRHGIEGLTDAARCSEDELVMHCGVGICGNCYEVGPEVMAACGMQCEGTGPRHLDLRERLVSTAAELGLKSITSSTWCTAHDQSHFHSHRASRGGAGRMAAYIGIIEPSSS